MEIAAIRQLNHKTIEQNQHKSIPETETGTIAVAIGKGIGGDTHSRSVREREMNFHSFQ